jgi:hypothetical protein
MADFEYAEHVTRVEAAQRLVDIAYALTGGDALELRHAGSHVTVPVADDVVLVRRTTSTGDEIEVDVLVTWSAPAVHDHETRGTTPYPGPRQA